MRLIEEDNIQGRRCLFDPRQYTLTPDRFERHDRCDLGSIRIAFVFLEKLLETPRIKNRELLVKTPSQLQLPLGSEARRANHQRRPNITTSAFLQQDQSSFNRLAEADLVAHQKAPGC